MTDERNTPDSQSKSSAGKRNKPVGKSKKQISKSEENSSWSGCFADLQVQDAAKPVRASRQLITAACRPVRATRQPTKGTHKLARATQQLQSKPQNGKCSKNKNPPCYGSLSTSKINTKAGQGSLPASTRNITAGKTSSSIGKAKQDVNWSR